MLRKALLIGLSISPAISLFRAWQTARGQVEGLLSNEAAMRELMPHLVWAGVVLIGFLIGCGVHLARNRRIGPVRKVAWFLGFLLLPIIFFPAYLFLHAGRS